jgi:transcriptional regulator with XRE-family HTH domain
MTDTKKVLRTLLTDCVGKQNAITQSQLSEATGLNPSTLRSELRRLREERNIPIANLRDGYFVIADKEELSEFVGHINKEIESKRNTIEHTTEAYAEFDKDDIEIDPEPETQEQTYDCSLEGCSRSMTRENTMWPKGGPYEDQTVCKNCYGDLVMNGEA